MSVKRYTVKIPSSGATDTHINIPINLEYPPPLWTKYLLFDIIIKSSSASSFNLVVTLNPFFPNNFLINSICSNDLPFQLSQCVGSRITCHPEIINTFLLFIFVI